MPRDLATRDADGVTARPISKRDTAQYEEHKGGFLAEDRRIVGLKHPNIVHCLDYTEANGTAYLVMEYEGGLPLAELLRQREQAGQPLTEKEIKQVILPLLDGLEAAHAQDILHRDIKPDNIFVRRADEQPVLIDFSAAKEGYSRQAKSLRQTHTPGYAPLEQMEVAGKLGPWTDIYAVGATMWRMINNQPRPSPYGPILSPPDVLDRNVVFRGGTDPLTPAVQLGVGRFTFAFLRVIDKRLALRETDRFQSVGELRRMLEGVAAMVRTTQHARHRRLRRTPEGTATRAPRQIVIKAKKPTVFNRKVLLVSVLAVTSLGATGYWYSQAHLPQVVELAQRQTEQQQRREASEATRLVEERRLAEELRRIAEAMTEKAWRDTEIAQKQVDQQRRRETAESARLAE